MKKALCTLVCLFVVSVTGVQNYYPTHLLDLQSHNRHPFAAGYGWENRKAESKPTPGNWTTPGGCIVGSMTLVLSVPTDPSDATQKIDITLDPSNKNVTVTGKCPKDSKTQEITLAWEDVDHIDKKNLLDRNITMIFTKNMNTSMYGITEISGTVEVRVVNKTGSSFVDIVGDFSSPLLETPVNQSYTCPSDGPISLNVTWPGSGTTTTTTTTTPTTTTTTTPTTTTSTATTTTTITTSNTSTALNITTNTSKNTSPATISTTKTITTTTTTIMSTTTNSINTTSFITKSTQRPTSTSATADPISTVQKSINNHTINSETRKQLKGNSHSAFLLSGSTTNVIIKDMQFLFVIVYYLY
eukprot:GFUD01001765.1.p1 GENE.GFUD01001765.1~~GFUD01001765.1.p1  ORF type:complete len:357 (-),score=66.14 GFUD01001765.1:17-1087(-)